MRIVDIVRALDAQVAATDEEALGAHALVSAWRAEELDALEASGDLTSVMSEIRSGGTPSRGNPAFYGGEIPWLKSGEVASPWIWDTEEKITSAAMSGSSAWLVPAGSVVVAMYGATAGQVGYVAAPMATNQAVLALVPDPDECDGRFAYQWFCHHSGQLKSAASGAAQPNLSKAVILREMRFPIADLAVQRRIAQSLDAAGKVAASLAGEARALRSYRARLLAALLAAEVEIPESYADLLAEVA